MSEAPTQEELLSTLQQWENKLHETRGALMAAQRAALAARGKTAEALTLWQTGEIKLTPAELIKQHLASEQELKRQRIEEGLHQRPVRNVAPSRIDREGAYSVGGTAEDMVRRNMRRGWRRGGMTSAQAAHVNVDRIRRRLPSER